MEKLPIRVAAVSYTNTIPFIYGLTRFPEITITPELILLPPAQCAEAFYTGAADLALVPVGAVRDEDLERLCCNWCLGATGAVETVLLLADTPLDRLHTVYLDSESRTSNLLVQILAKYYWNIQPAFLPGNKSANIKPTVGEGVVLIGDKTFGIRKAFRYAHDLAEVWQHYTGLPFVFACWMSAPEVDSGVREGFDQALQWGVAHIDEAVNVLNSSILSEEQVRRYLTQSISYHLDDDKREAIKLFNNLR
jgi:chorismate dehydratase